MYPMAGALFEYNIGILGRLESFSSDWERLIMPTYGIGRPYNEDFGRHPTSVFHPHDKKRNLTELLSLFVDRRSLARDKGKKKDGKAVPANGQYVDNARNVLIDLLHSHPEYMRAICHLILVDYVCLPDYPMPKSCGFLNRTREAVIRSVRKGLMILPYS
jgi:hypothetical protein